MSVDSVRKRIEAATPGPWETYDANEGEHRPLWCVANDAFHNPSSDDEPWIAVEIHVGQREDADLIAHAPTDLAAALKVIEAAKVVLPSVMYHVRRVAVSRETEAQANALRDALKEFEALP